MPDNPPVPAGWSEIPPPPSDWQEVGSSVGSKDYGIRFGPWKNGQIPMDVALARQNKGKKAAPNPYDWQTASSEIEQPPEETLQVGRIVHKGETSVRPEAPSYVPKKLKGKMTVEEFQRATGPQTIKEGLTTPLGMGRDIQAALTQPGRGGIAQSVNTLLGMSEPENAALLAGAAFAPEAVQPALATLFAGQMAPDIIADALTGHPLAAAAKTGMAALPFAHPLISGALGKFKPKEVREVSMPVEKPPAPVTDSAGRTYIQDGVTPEGKPIYRLQKRGEANAVGIGRTETVGEQPGGTQGVGTGGSGRVEPGIQGNEPPGAGVADAGTVPNNDAGGPTSLANTLNDLKRLVRGDEETERAPKVSNQQLIDRGKAAIDSGDIVPHTLIANLIEKPRPLNLEESGALAVHSQRVEAAFDKASKTQDEVFADPNAAPEAKNEASAAFNNSLDDLRAYEEAVKKVGTHQGQTLQARSILVDRQENAAGTMRELYAKDPNRPLSPRQIEIARAMDEIPKLKEELAQKDAAHAADVAKIHGDYKAQAEMEDARKAVRSAERYAKSQARAGRLGDIRAQRAQIGERIQKKLSRLSAGIPADVLPEVAELVKTYAQEGVVNAEAMVDAVHGFLKDHIPDLDRDSVREAIAKIGSVKVPRAYDETAYQKRLQSRISDYEKRIAAGDTSPMVQRVEREYAAETQALREKLRRLRLQRAEIIKAREAQNPFNLLPNIYRFMLLAGVKVLGKISAASGTRILTSPMENLLGIGISKLPGLRGIAKNAPTEGTTSLKAEAAGLRGVFSRMGIKAVKDAALTGKTYMDLDYYDKTGKLPPGMYLEEPGVKTILDFPGRLHAALKTPASVQAFERGLVNVAEWQKKNGIDVDSPQAQLQRTVLAYEKAAEAKFQQENLFSQGLKGGLATLERQGTAGKALAAGTRMALPITKVPTNVALELANYPAGAGWVNATARIVKALRSEEGFTPEVADGILRAAKKGSMGAVVTALGWYGYKHLINKDGTEMVDKSLTHSPVLDDMMLMANLRWNWERHKSIPSGAFNFFKQYSEEYPVVREAETISRGLENEASAGKAIGGIAASVVIPRGVAEYAEYSDQNVRPPRYRKTKGFKDEFKKRIPGAKFRESLRTGVYRPK